MAQADARLRFPWLPRVARELPLVVGIGLGWFLLWMRGSAWVVPEFPSGMGWEAYFQLARNLALGEDSGPSNVTKPFYPFLLQWVGERSSYNGAAALISSAAMDAVVLAAGLLARLLAGPWAGALAALAVPMVDEFAQASRWANLYPVLGACTGLSLVAALLTSRHRHFGWPLASGVLAALAWTTDWRGAIVIPVSAGLVLLSLQRSPRSWLALLWFSGGLLAAPLLTGVVTVRVDQPWDMQLDGERIARAESIALVDTRVRSACQGAFMNDLPDLAWYSTECSRAIVWWNRMATRGHVPIDVQHCWWLALLSLVPLRGRRVRSVLESGLVLGAGAGLLWALAGWAVLPGRYTVHLAAPLCAVVAVGLFRPLDWVGVIHERVGRGLVAAAGIGLGVWLWFQMEAGKVRPTIAAPAYVSMMEDLGARLRPEDSLMDCAGGSVEMAWLPRLLHDRSKGGAPMDARACAGWIAQPMVGSGERYLLLGPADDRPGEPLNFDPGATGLWTRIHSFERARGAVGLWKFGPPSAEDVQDAPRKE